MARYTIRETTPGDEAALSALYKRLTGIDRTHAQYAWEWREGPLGPAPSWVVVDDACDRLVAHHGVIPVPLIYQGQSLSAARTENTMLDPDYRGRILYHGYEAQILSRLRDRFEILFTTSGKGAWGVVRQRLGYRPAGDWQTLILGATASYMARRAIGRLAPASLPSVFAKGRDTWGALEPTSDLSRIGTLIEQANTPCAGMRIARTPAYVKWRLVDHPYHRFQLGLLTRDGRDQGFVAWRENAGPRGTVEIRIEDVCFKDTSEDAMAAWFATIADHWRDRPARIQFRTLTNAPYANAAMRIAPARLQRLPPEDAARLLVLGEDRMIESQWWVTMLLAQGI